MTKFLQNMAFVGLLIAGVYYFASAIFPMDKLMIPLTGAAVGSAVLVCIVYAPLFWQSTWRIESRVSVLAIGMGLLWGSFLGIRLTSVAYRAAGQADQLTNNRLIGFFVLMGLFAGIFHVVAPGYPAEGFREKFGGRYRWLILAFVIGGAAAAVALAQVGIAL